MIEKAIYSLLTNDADVAALVSSRVFPNVAPQGGTRPYVTYGRIDTEHVTTHSGSSGLANASMQLDVWGESYAQVKNLAEKVRLVLHGYKGIAAGVDVRGIIPGSEIDAWGDDPTFDGGEEALHRVTMTFTAWFWETVPS